MAHNFRVIQGTDKVTGETLYYSLCIEGNSRDGCCYVSSTYPTPRLAFLFGLYHQKKERGTLTYR